MDRTKSTPTDYTPSPKPFTLTEKDIERVHKLVKQFLPPEYDREYIADSIILNAWTNEIQHISRGYIRNKCISAYRKLQSELKRNEGAFRSGTKPMISDPNSLDSQEEVDEFLDKKELVEKAIIGGRLTPFERKLVWMRFYDNQTLEEMVGVVRLRRDEIQRALQVALYKMRVYLS